MTNLFESVVGQEELKKKLSFYLRAYPETHIFPNTMLCASKGQGKSLVCREIAKQLIAYGDDGKPLMKEDGITFKKKTFLEINASTIKSVRQFVNSVLIPNVDRATTIFFDEASEIKKDLTMSLLTILNPCQQNKNTFVFDEQVIDIDFRRTTFLFATSESHNVFGPLMDRLNRVNLQHYTGEDLQNIVQKSAPEVSFKDGILEKIATVVRGNARMCVKMANDIRTYLRHKTVFGTNEWNDLSGILSIKPLGLSSVEIDLLHFLQSRPDGSSLTNLAARSGLSTEAVRRDYESFLQYCGLMAITPGKGRQLTKQGYDYLKVLDACPC
jgi:Holliday junction resolvasome RuvABC ATP-dependent DNA helicase subunit